MLDPRRIENAILTALSKPSPDDWRPCTISGLRNWIRGDDKRVANESHNNLIDAVVALCEEDLLLARRWEDGHFSAFDLRRRRYEWYINSFFSHPGFELKLTHKGKRRAHANVAKAALVQAKTSRTLAGLKPAVERSQKTDHQWDVFISHASEDKAEFVELLAKELLNRGLKVWYDKFTLTLGDSLRESIDYGLRYSRFGVVVLSPSFFRKDWPRKELDGLAALEVNGRKVILPVWHNVTRDEVANYSPMLAGRLAISSSAGLKTVVDEIMKAVT